MSRIEAPRVIDDDERAAETYEMVVRHVYGWCRAVSPLDPTDRMCIDVVRYHHRPWSLVLDAYVLADEEDILRVYPHGDRRLIPLTEWGLLQAIEHEKEQFEPEDRDREHIGRCSRWLAKLRERARADAEAEREASA